VVIGFIVYGIIILVGPITGAALNPARQIGPEILGGLIGAKTHLDQLWVYIAGPILGGLAGAYLYEFIGHTRTATVPGAAVAEVAHADA
jgi:glycerol uptake facilitator protein